MILITVQGNPWAVNSTTASGLDCLRRGDGNVARSGEEFPGISGLAEAVGDEGRMAENPAKTL